MLMHKTITDLLLHATQQPIDRGSQAQAYNFPYSQPGFENFVIRVARGTRLTRDLLAHSSLVPVSRLVSGIHVGQPLMELAGHPGVTIHLKQPGTALKQLDSEYRGQILSDPIEIDSACSHIESILNLQVGAKNPFVPVLEQVYQMGALGYFHDLQFRNILLDTDAKCLRLVDQVAYPNPHPNTGASEGALELKRSVEQILSQVNGLFKLAHTVDEEKAMRLKSDIAGLESLIKRAYTQVRQNPPQGDRVGFATVTNTSAISLDDPPRVLVERLRQLTQDAAIPTR